MIGLVIAATLAAGPVDGFLERNATRPGVKVLAEGIQYRVLASGAKTAAVPRLQDKVTVHYEGRFLTGGVFDSSYVENKPITFPLKGLIRCWGAVLPKMRVGDEWVVFCPSATAYGKKGAGGVIPPDTTLAFRIRLLGVERQD